MNPIFIASFVGPVGFATVQKYPATLAAMMMTTTMATIFLFFLLLVTLIETVAFRGPRMYI